MFSEIQLEIADICIELHVRDAAVAQEIQSRYGAFAVSDRTPRVRINIDVQEDARFLPLPSENREHVVQVEFSENRLDFASHYGVGTADLDQGAGWLALQPGSMVDLENFLRALYAWLGLSRNALLVHGASIVREGKAYVFFGNSGSGKTTVAKLSSEHTVLSDDLTIISENEGRYWVHGIPFRGLHFEWPISKEKAPLAGMYRLRKDGEHRVQILPKPQAVAELVTCLPFLAGNQAAYERALATCHDLVARIPVATLCFRRDHRFWEVVLHE